jgi:hypothetical protein
MTDDASQSGRSPEVVEAIRRIREAQIREYERRGRTITPLSDEERDQIVRRIRQARIREVEERRRAS